MAVTCIHSHGSFALSCSEWCFTDICLSLHALLLHLLPLLPRLQIFQHPTLHTAIKARKPNTTMLHAVDTFWDSMYKLVPGNWPRQADCYASTGNPDCNRPIALWLLTAIPLLFLLCILIGLLGGFIYHCFITSHTNPETDGFIYYTPSEEWLEGQKWLRLAEEERAAKYLRWEARQEARAAHLRRREAEERRARHKHRTAALALLEAESMTTQADRVREEEQQERHRRNAFEALDGQGESHKRVSAPHWWKDQRERVGQTEFAVVEPSRAAIPIPRIEIERAREHVGEKGG
ncbi:hypothetical protein BDV96DRAFT_308316 [Lophiotrema nucula]|uniref:Uncharacterized protein n=1 Tax=Lophiotrema nucula TaxID=690887 RepID=A0A6A5YIE9_9PLEO|nr:hypothetical protein BDV96DRAFT_308316 [Lophiotrema nucula]